MPDRLKWPQTKAQHLSFFFPALSGLLSAFVKILQLVDLNLITFGFISRGVGMLSLLEQKRRGLGLKSILGDKHSCILMKWAVSMKGGLCCLSGIAYQLLSRLCTRGYHIDSPSYKIFYCQTQNKYSFLYNKPCSKCFLFLCCVSISWTACVSIITALYLQTDWNLSYSYREFLFPWWRRRLVARM